MRGPYLSHSGPITRRARMVANTPAMLRLAIWMVVRWNSPRTTGISGATANQAKKHTKNATHVMWKARICGVEKLNRSMLVAFWEAAMRGSVRGCGRSLEQPEGRPRGTQRQRTPPPRPVAGGRVARYSAATAWPWSREATGAPMARPHGPTQVRVHLRWNIIRLPSTTAENAA